VPPLREADLGGMRPPRRAGDGRGPSGGPLHLPPAQVSPRAPPRPL